MTSTEDFRAKLADDDGSLPERWNAEDTVGATLVGVYLRTDSIVTKLGPAQVAVIEDEDDGTVYGVLLGRSVLKNRWEKLDPRPGDTVGLKYVGFVEPRDKNSNGYHSYVLHVLRNPNPSVVEQPSRAAPPPADDLDLPF